MENKDKLKIALEAIAKLEAHISLMEAHYQNLRAERDEIAQQLYETRKRLTDWLELDCTV